LLQLPLRQQQGPNPTSAGSYDASQNLLTFFESPVLLVSLLLQKLESFVILGLRHPTGRVATQGLRHRDGALNLRPEVFRAVLPDINKTLLGLIGDISQVA
jgi:hypothetical protein